MSWSAAPCRHAAHALREHALTLDLPEEPPLLFADAVLMERVVCNLIDNAIAHTPAGGHIVLSAQGAPPSIAEQ